VIRSPNRRSHRKFQDLIEDLGTERHHLRSFLFPLGCLLLGSLLLGFALGCLLLGGFLLGLAFGCLLLGSLLLGLAFGRLLLGGFLLCLALGCLLLGNLLLGLALGCLLLGGFLALWRRLLRRFLLLLGHSLSSIQSGGNSSIQNSVRALLWLQHKFLDGESCLKETSHPSGMT
jgi:hypothetical protein